MNKVVIAANLLPISSLYIVEEEKTSKIVFMSFLLEIEKF